MEIEELKKVVYEENIRLYKSGLVKLTWGNVSQVDREKGIMAIKPSGISYDELKIDDIVVLSLDGKIIDGKLKPSSDTPTHLYLYNHFKEIGGIVHTHSPFATSFAQAKKSIISLGTTHADSFYQEVPCTRDLTKEEIENDYEKNTGKVIVETFKDRDYLATPAVLIASHGPFTWGKDANSALNNSIILEEVAKMAIYTLLIDKNVKPIDKDLENKHYSRKHGKNAYYGQK